MEKSTSRSVTAKPCRCGMLEWAADNPDLPVTFDPELNEYNFEFPSPCADGACDGAKATMLIYHCFFCGGAAPTSKRGQLFAGISVAERRRINRLFKGLRTLVEVVERLGPPDEDLPHGLTVERPGKDGKAPTVRTYRVLRYTLLSDTADVDVSFDPVEGVQVGLSGKYIGRPDE